MLAGFGRRRGSVGRCTSLGVVLTIASVSRSARISSKPTGRRRIFLAKADRLSSERV